MCIRDRFSNDVLVLVPINPTPFINITKKILEKWPQLQYYNGKYDNIAPHVTLAYGNSKELKQLGKFLKKFTPIEAKCCTINIKTGGSGSMKILEKIVL